MRRVAMAMALMALSSNVAAAWVRVGSNHDILGCYADPGSIRKKGELAIMSSLIDFKVPQGDQSLGAAPYLSQKEQREYDCKATRYRLLHITLRGGNMGSGKTVGGLPISRDWSPVVVGSLGEALWKFACRRK